jgi:hypothetical protein
LRFGADLKDKVLRSMAAGVSCVGTHEAFSGIAGLPDALTNDCIAETAADLAAVIVRMHRDAAVNAGCAELGMAHVQDNYNAARIDALMRELAEPALRCYQTTHDRAVSDSRVLSFHDQLAGRTRSLSKRQEKAATTLVFGGRASAY